MKCSVGLHTLSELRLLFPGEWGFAEVCWQKKGVGKCRDKKCGRDSGRVCDKREGGRKIHNPVAGFCSPFLLLL